MRLYESVFIARQDVSVAQVETLTDELSKIITKGGGKILKHEYWGLKSLAYRIKKNRKGHYTMFNMEASSETMAEYGRLINLNEDVLRVLTIRIDEVDPEPSIMMQAKSGQTEDGLDGDEDNYAGDDAGDENLEADADDSIESESEDKTKDEKKE